MKNNDSMILLEVTDSTLAEDIQQILEESAIYSIIASDNPASSLLNIYSGLNPSENITIKVNKDDYQKAVDIINHSIYKDLLPS
jgi:hypothetical protein